MDRQATHTTHHFHQKNITIPHFHRVVQSRRSPRSLPSKLSHESPVPTDDLLFPELSVSPCTLAADNEIATILQSPDRGEPSDLELDLDVDAELCLRCHNPGLIHMFT